MKRFTLALTVILLSTSISAQLVQQASKEDLIEKLTPPASPASPASRSLRNLVPKPVNVDLSIHFDFDSARLQAQSKPLLDNLAQAMNSARLSAMKFKVEGHTDAKGNTEYNQALSARRASAVQAYLIGQNVEAERLEAEGKGASELLIPEKPMASENRRVRISVRP